MDWGTWEELLLGGAVLRHGTGDWDLVSSELRVRTRSLPPFFLTPQACKAKYEDLRRGYRGNKTLFEALRQLRIAELRRALEVSEGSIGSLETKIQILKAEGRDECHVDYDSSRTESDIPVPLQISEGIKSSVKETSKDGLSAGSFTRQNSSPDSHVPSSLPAEEIDRKPKITLSPKRGGASNVLRFTGTVFLGKDVVCLKRKRGKRKRKICSSNVKEGSVGECELLAPTEGLSANRRQDNPASGSGQKARGFDSNDRSRVSIKELFSSIAENKCACVFRKRLDSQKRSRYKKMILQHMDLNTIRSRISNRTITSLKELFRDLLLLANNAMVFYSKITREYKSALLLREIVTKSLRQHLKDYINGTTIALRSNTTSFLLNPPAEPRSPRSGNRKWIGKASKQLNPAPKGPPNTSRKRNNKSHSPAAEASLPATKKVAGRAGKGRRACNEPLPENSTKARKRSRAK